MPAIEKKNISIQNQNFGYGNQICFCVHTDNNFKSEKIDFLCNQNFKFIFGFFFAKSQISLKQMFLYISLRNVYLKSLKKFLEKGS